MAQVVADGWLIDYAGALPEDAVMRIWCIPDNCRVWSAVEDAKAAVGHTHDKAEGLRHTKNLDGSRSNHEPIILAIRLRARDLPHERVIDSAVIPKSLKIYCREFGVINIQARET